MKHFKENRGFEKPENLRFGYSLICSANTYQVSPVVRYYCGPWVCNGEWNRRRLLPVGGFAVVGLPAPRPPPPNHAESAHVHSRPQDVLCALGLEEYLLSSFSLLVLFHLLSRWRNWGSEKRIFSGPLGNLSGKVESWFWICCPECRLSFGHWTAGTS